MKENKTPIREGEVEEVKDEIKPETEKTSEEKTDSKKKTKKAKKSKIFKIEKTEEEKKEEAERKKKNKPKDVKGSAKRLISYITRQKVWLVVVAILVVLSTAVTVCSSLIMQPVYAAIENVISGGDPDAAFAKIVKALVAMSAAYLISSVMSYAYTRIMLTVSVKTLTNMRRELFNHMQSLPISFFDKRRVGEIMSHFTNDVGRVSDLVQNTFVNLISSFITAILTITIMIIYSWQITLTITVSIVLMFAIVIIITTICAPLFKKQQQTLAQCNGYIEEYIKGIKVVKLFCYEERTKKEFAEINEEYRKTGVKASIIGGLMSPIMSMIMRINYAAAVSIGAMRVIKGKMSIPQLVTYLQYVGSYASPVASIASSYSTLISALAGAERVFAVLDADPETDEGKVALVRTIKNIMGYEEENEEGSLSWKVPEEDGSFSYVPVKGEIDIKDISFSYVEGTPILKHVSAHANGSEKLAFVGSTGAGKTTITNLINRFYELDEGDITIDGISIKDIKKDDLRNSMAFVLQDSKLFEGTIAKNIKYGKLDATEEEMIEAAKIANAHSFIEKLPDGYETNLNGEGVNISWGQAQLINIARAAISGRPILVLDEATSSVDTRTERIIEKGMDTLMQEKTVVVIAHRLSTVRNSEDIVVLEGGEVIENGNHNALIALGGKYYQLYTGSFEME